MQSYSFLVGYVTWRNCDHVAIYNLNVALYTLTHGTLKYGCHGVETIYSGKLQLAYNQLQLYYRPVRQSVIFSKFNLSTRTF